MEVFINELSLPPHETPLPAKEGFIINAFLNTLKTINTLNKNKQPQYLLKNENIFEANTSFICQKSLHQLYEQLPREEKIILLSFMDKIKILSSAPTDIHTEQVSLLQTSAFSSYKNETTKSFSICLASSARWDCPEIHYRSANHNNIEAIANLTNPELSQLSSAVSKMMPLLKYFASQHISTKGAILPKAIISNYLLQNKEFQTALNSAKNLPAAQRNSAYSIVGTAIAEINCYTHNTHLSTINSSRHKTRKIYTSSDFKTHISIDFMHGCFEAHKINGEHIKEIAFTGEEISARDTTGKHDIRTQ